MPPDGHIPRHLRVEVLASLAESRGVAVLGARQVGKSTLVADLAGGDHPARLLTLDDPGAAAAARADPVGFLAAVDGPVAIDEVQRAPELLLAIKRRLDADDAPGQVLLTGSADLLTLGTVADALPGRLDYLTLWPLSQGELRRVRETFVDDLFDGRPPWLAGAPVGREPVVEMLCRGGYPEARRRSERLRERFFESYVASLLRRDLGDVGTVRSTEGVGRLLSTVAARSAGLANLAALGRDLALDGKTVAAHLRLLEELFLLRRLPPWHANMGSRRTKAPKLHLVDTGLLLHLVAADASRLASDGELFGSALESFVVGELVRQQSWTDRPAALHHYRDDRGREVDVVLERRDGSVVGVEVKGGATPSPRDAAGLRHLRDALGPRFRAGVVLHTGPDTLPLGDRLTAVPVSGLWTPAASG